MRIVSGKYRGRKLFTPKGEAIRPTADAVKESIFNIIRANIEGAACFDMFAGTGQLGIEALSCGAGSCLFTDSSAEAVELIKKNLKLLDVSNYTVKQTDALSVPGTGQKYDIVFIDPPYNSGLAEKAIEALIKFDNLRNSGIIVCETAAESEMPGEPGFTRREYKYGKIKLTVYRKIA